MTAVAVAAVACCAWLAAAVTALVWLLAAYRRDETRRWYQ